MSNAVVVKTDNIFQNMTDMERFANFAVKSGQYKDIKDVATAVVRIQVGREMGLSAAASLKSIQMIGGTPTFSAAFVAAQIKKSKPRYNFRPKTVSDKECTLTFFEDGEVAGEYTYTIEEARRAELTGKDVWRKYPKSMLFCRALTAGARMYCSDVTVFPIYTSEELGGEPHAEDILEDEQKPERTSGATSEVSIEDRFALLNSCVAQGIDIRRVLKNIGAQSLESMTEPEFKRATQFVNSNKGEQ